jgi:hypothetical protein
LSFDLTAPKDFLSDFSNEPVIVKAGEKGELSFKGTANLPEMSVLSLRVETKGKLEGRDYVIDDSSVDISIKASPLSLKISLTNVASENGAKPGNILNYHLTCGNLSDEAFKNVVIKASFRGSMYDLAKISVAEGGSLNAGTIFWNYATDPNLTVLDPDESRGIDVEIPLKPNYSIRQASDKDFMVTMIAEATATVASTGLKLKNVVISDTKLSGSLAIDSEVYFRDADSGIVNSGSLPLKVATPTDFTVHWFLSNKATDMSNIEIRAVLPVGVVLTGSQKVAVGELNYDALSKEAVWKIPRMLANTGIVDKPLEATFQIRATPIDEFTGSYMPLLRETRASATDDFSGAVVSASAAPLNSSLTDDSTVNPLDGLVRQ